MANNKLTMAKQQPENSVFVQGMLSGLQLGIQQLYLVCSD